MKPGTVWLLIFLFASKDGFSQRESAGVQVLAGAGYSLLRNSTDRDSGVATSGSFVPVFSVSGTLPIRESRLIDRIAAGIEYADVRFSRQLPNKPATGISVAGSSSSKLSYLSLPVQVHFKVAESGNLKLTAYGGLKFSILLSSRLSGETTWTYGNGYRIALAEEIRNKDFKVEQTNSYYAVNQVIAHYDRSGTANGPVYSRFVVSPALGFSVQRMLGTSFGVLLDGGVSMNLNNLERKGTLNVNQQLGTAVYPDDAYWNNERSVSHLLLPSLQIGLTYKL